MEMMEMDAQSMQAAFNEAKYQLESLGNGMCKGDGSPWQVVKWQRTKGSGGPGQGHGASPADSPFEFDTKSRKTKVQNKGGPIIARMLVDGPQLTGESRAAFSGAVAAGEQAASDAIDNMIVPREYQGAVKAYFGTLGEQGGG